MSWSVTWTERALKDAEKLDRQVRVRIVKALDRSAETGQGNVKRLTGGGGDLRLRVGDWRVRFSFYHASRTIMVLRVLPRGEAYRE